METPTDANGIGMNAAEYESFSRFLHDACGISLGANKQYLVATRMRRILQEHKIATLAELTRRAASEQERALRQQVIDAMTINETLWFRDNYPFEYLAKTFLPQIAERPGRPLRIWSAACATGQEPYSISMVIEECLRGRMRPQVNPEILATDLSSSALEAAKQAQYDRLSLARGLSATRAEQFFTPTADNTWVLNDSVRQRVKFRPFNLQDPYYALGKFDIIFCRNVLIYFSSESKQKILTKLHACLNPAGLLFLGASESVTGASQLFEMVDCNPGIAFRAR